MTEIEIYAWFTTRGCSVLRHGHCFFFLLLPFRCYPPAHYEILDALHRFKLPCSGE